MALTYVIAYDISDDHRRARVAAILQTHGDRIQRSVFLVTTDDTTLAEARQRIEEIINPATDSVYVFRQCAACWDAVGIHGQATAADEPLCWTVFLYSKGWLAIMIGRAHLCRVSTSANTLQGRL